MKGFSYSAQCARNFCLTNPPLRNHGRENLPPLTPTPLDPLPPFLSLSLFLSLSETHNLKEMYTLPTLTPDPNPGSPLS